VQSCEIGVQLRRKQLFIKQAFRCDRERIPLADQLTASAVSGDQLTVSVPFAQASASVNIVEFLLVALVYVAVEQDQARRSDCRQHSSSSSSRGFYSS
jgi:hypothetical protein